MIINENKKAWFEYSIEDQFEAGIKLEGWEVKSIRKKQVSLVSAHAVIRNNVVFLIGMKVDPLKEVSTHVTPVPERTRELLLHSEEIEKLVTKISERGYTLIPLNVSISHGLVKVKLGLARGKKLHDKKEAIKSRDTARETSRQLKDVKLQ